MTVFDIFYRVLSDKVPEIETLHFTICIGMQYTNYIFILGLVIVHFVNPIFSHKNRGSFLKHLIYRLFLFNLPIIDY